MGNLFCRGMCPRRQDARCESLIPTNLKPFQNQLVVGSFEEPHFHQIGNDFEWLQVQRPAKGRQGRQMRRKLGEIEKSKC